MKVLNKYNCIYNIFYIRSIEKTPSKASRINRSTTMNGNSNPSS